MPAWLIYFVLIGLLCARTQSIEVEKSFTNDELAKRLWSDIPAPTPGTKCSVSGNAGVCVPLIGQCPILQQQIRNVISPLLVPYLAVFMNECGAGGGYCCPDFNKSWTQTEMDTEKKPPKEIIYNNQFTIGLFGLMTEATSWNHPIAESTEKTKQEPTQEITTTVRECGKFNTKSLRIRNVNGVKFGNFPWHASIYSQRPFEETEFRCAGSLVSKTVIITAAYCFLHDNKGKLQNKKNLHVTLGNRHLNFFDRRDIPNHQTFGVRDIFIPKEWNQLPYPRAENIDYNIAVLVLDKEAKFGDAVQPVCLDLGDSSSENESLKPGAIGLVADRGALGKRGTISDEYIIVSVPYLDKEGCEKDFNCARSLKDDQFSGQGVEFEGDRCGGEEGRGYVTKDPNTGKMFLRGVGGSGFFGCDHTTFALFTRISNYSSFINEHLLNH